MFISGWGIQSCIVTAQYAWKWDVQARVQLANVVEYCFIFTGRNS